MVIIVAMDVLLNRRLIKLGYSPFELVVYPMAISVIVATIGWIIIGDAGNRLGLRGVDADHIWMWLVLGVTFFGAFIILRQAQVVSPNIGYVNVIVGTSALFTAIITAWMYHDDISIRAIIGIIVSIIGLYLVVT